MLNRFIKDMKKHYKYAIYSAKAELKAEVAGSYLNWIWWILEPICFMFIYALIFGYVYKRQSLDMCLMQKNNIFYHLFLLESQCGISFPKI